MCNKSAMSQQKEGELWQITGYAVDGTISYSLAVAQIQVR